MCNLSFIGYILFLATLLNFLIHSNNLSMEFLKFFNQTVTLAADNKLYFSFPIHRSFMSLFCPPRVTGPSSTGVTWNKVVI